MKLHDFIKCKPDESSDHYPNVSFVGDVPPANLSNAYRHMLGRLSWKRSVVQGIGCRNGNYTERGGACYAWWYHYAPDITNLIFTMYSRTKEGVLPPEFVEFFTSPNNPCYDECISKLDVKIYHTDNPNIKFLHIDNVRNVHIKHTLAWVKQLRIFTEGNGRDCMWMYLTKHFPGMDAKTKTLLSQYFIFPARKTSTAGETIYIEDHEETKYAYYRRNVATHGTFINSGTLNMNFARVVRGWYNHKPYKGKSYEFGEYDSLWSFDAKQKSVDHSQQLNNIISYGVPEKVYEEVASSRFAKAAQKSQLNDVNGPDYFSYPPRGIPLNKFPDVISYTLQLIEKYRNDTETKEVQAA